MPLAPAPGASSPPTGKSLTPIFMPVGTAGAVKAVTREHLAAAGGADRPRQHLPLDAPARRRAWCASWVGCTASPAGSRALADRQRRLPGLQPRRAATDQRGRACASRATWTGRGTSCPPSAPWRSSRTSAPTSPWPSTSARPGQRAKEAVAEATARTTRWAERCRSAHTRERPGPLRHRAGRRTRGPARSRARRQIVALGFPGNAIGGRVGGGAQGRTRPGAWNGSTPCCPRTSRATSWGWAPPKTSWKAWRAASTCSTACCPPAMPATASSSPAGASCPSATPASSETRCRPIRSAPAPPAGPRAAPTCATSTCAGEVTGMVLATIHNLFFYLDMMGRMRQHICLGRFEEFRRETLAALQGPAAEGDASRARGTPARGRRHPPNRREDEDDGRSPPPAPPRRLAPGRRAEPAAQLHPHGAHLLGSSTSCSSCP